MDIKEHVKTFGTLTANEILDKKIEKKSFLDMKVDNSREIDIKLTDDKSIPWITGCAFMTDGQLVLCDRNNNKIKTLNSSFEIKGNLYLKGQPWDVSVVDSSTAIITMPEIKQLHFIKLVPSLQAERIIQLDFVCYGVEVVDKDIYTICNDAGIHKVRVLDMAGNIIRKNGTPLGHREWPFYLTVSTTDKTIYISDCGTNSVTCLKSDGSKSYYYEDSELQGPRGVLLDDDDNILICGYDSSNIHVVTSDGKKLGLLITSQDCLDGPSSLAYRRSDNMLVVGGSKLATVLKLAKR